MNETKEAKDYVAIALDTAERWQFEHWCERFGGRAGTLKVGLETFMRWGPEAVRLATGTGSRVFLDVKLHDIPNTVAGAVRGLADLGVSYVTVHAGGGSRMLEAAVEAAKLADGPAILAVTVLTHLENAELIELDLPGGSAERVSRWAELAAGSGCDGIVCSPREAAAVAGLRSAFEARAGSDGPGGPDSEMPTRPKRLEIVTPGIRPDGGFEENGFADDQRRTATPAEALGAGADLLVVGRPVTRARDPERALALLIDEIEAALPPR